jgi:hypothetical protein
MPTFATVKDARTLPAAGRTVRRRLREGLCGGDSLLALPLAPKLVKAVSNVSLAKSYEAIACDKSCIALPFPSAAALLTASSAFFTSTCNSSNDFFNSCNSIIVVAVAYTSVGWRRGYEGENAVPDNNKTKKSLTAINKDTTALKI